MDPPGSAPPTPSNWPLQTCPFIINSALFANKDLRTKLKVNIIYRRPKSTYSVGKEKSLTQHENQLCIFSLYVSFVLSLGIFGAISDERTTANIYSDHWIFNSQMECEKQTNHSSYHITLVIFVHLFMVICRKYWL